MAEENPEAHPDQVPQEHKEEKKKGTLESVVDELWSAGKKAITIGAIAAMPFLYGYVNPSHIKNAQVVSYSLAASKVTANAIQEKPALESTVMEASKGFILSYPTAKAFGALNAWEPSLEANYGRLAAKAIKAGTWTFGVQPSLVTGNLAMTYGIGKKFRENWWPRIKSTFKTVGIAGGLNAAYISSYGLFPQMAAASVLWYIFGLVQALHTDKGSMKNLYKKMNPLPYIGAGASLTGKLVKDTFKGLYEPVYAIGSAARDYSKKLYSNSKSAASANNAPAGAH